MIRTPRFLSDTILAHCTVLALSTPATRAPTISLRPAFPHPIKVGKPGRTEDSWPGSFFKEPLLSVVRGLVASDCIPSSLAGIPLCPSTAAKRTKHGDRGAGDTGSPLAYRPDCLQPSEGPLPALGTRQRGTHSRSGVTGCVTLRWEKGVQARALLSVQPAAGHPGPSSLRVPKPPELPSPHKGK